MQVGYIKGFQVSTVRTMRPVERHGLVKQYCIGELLTEIGLVSEV